MSEVILNSADVVVVMTKHLREQVTRILIYDHWERIVRFNNFCFGESTDLPDPHYQTEHVYRICFNRIESGCKKIIEKLNTNT
ncbi:MAG: hypothetical protein NC453_16845 [Muribaculum sp.]|nr:hypothetical protein [Muribaculum sp.]